MFHLLPVQQELLNSLYCVHCSPYHPVCTLHTTALCVQSVQHCFVKPVCVHSVRWRPARPVWPRLSTSWQYRAVQGECVHPASPDSASLPLPLDGPAGVLLPLLPAEELLPLSSPGSPAPATDGLGMATNGLDLATNGLDVDILCLDVATHCLDVTTQCLDVTTHCLDVATVY